MNDDLCVFINSNIDSLAEKILNVQYSRQDGIAKRYDARGRALCMRDVKYHISYLSEAMEVDSVSIFIDYVKWVDGLLTNLKLPPEDLLVNLECVKEVLIDEAGKSFEPVLARYIDSALERLRVKDETPLGYIKKDSPYYDLASKYINYLINADRNSALKLIMDAVKNNVSVKDLYLHVFQNTQREIGRLWHENKISVACEHFCTAATQLIISQLYPQIFSKDKNPENKDFTVIAACAANELHEIGLRMIADFLELEGYNTHYLGANVPKESIVKTILERKADVLALSATITFHVRNVADIITEIKRSDKCRNVKVMVGGYPFNVDENLWKTIKADGYAGDMTNVAMEVGRLLH